MLSSIIILVLGLVLACTAQTQPNITFVNLRSYPVYLCSINSLGGLADSVVIASGSVNTLTVTPDSNVGKYHVIPKDIYPDCKVIYDNTNSYAVEATGPVFRGSKFVSLIIDQFATQGYPNGVQSISLWQSGVATKLFCGVSMCGSNGVDEGVLPAKDMECHIL